LCSAAGKVGNRKPCIEIFTKDSKIRRKLETVFKVHDEQQDMKVTDSNDMKR